MRKAVRYGLWTLSVVVALVLVAGGFLWWKLRPRVEPIPAQLADVPDVEAIRSFRLRDLVVGDLRGKTAYFVIEGRESMESGEGRALTSALNRWEFPSDVAGYWIAEVEGLGMLSFKIDDYIERFAAESRLPIYADYDGVFLRGFKLPKGHSAIVVLGPDTEVLHRHTGPMTDADVDELRRVLGASEPAPGEPAPAFAAGAVTTDNCRGRMCALVFLGEPVARARVPGIDGGFDGDSDEVARLFDNPSIRLASMFSDRALSPDDGRGVFVGEAADVPLADGWELHADTGQLRAQLGLPADEAGLVIVDREGRVAMREHGRIPLYRLTRARELLGIRDGDD